MIFLYAQTDKPIHRYTDTPIGNPKIYPNVFIMPQLVMWFLLEIP